jgi:hypothetical protein
MCAACGSPREMDIPPFFRWPAFATSTAERQGALLATFVRRLRCSRGTILSGSDCSFGSRHDPGSTSLPVPSFGAARFGLSAPRAHFARAPVSDRDVPVLSPPVRPSGPLASPRLERAPLSSAVLEGPRAHGRARGSLSHSTCAFTRCSRLPRCVPLCNPCRRRTRPGPAPCSLPCE